MVVPLSLSTGFQHKSREVLIYLGATLKGLLQQVAAWC
jgi:hypothetical protein